MNQLAKDKKTGKIYKLKEKLGLNLIGDGIGDIVSGMIGGPAGTNYGENISTMAISKNFSIGVLVAGGSHYHVHLVLYTVNQLDLFNS